MLADFTAEVTFDRVHVLAELPGRVWRPIADAPLGEKPGRGRAGQPAARARRPRAAPTSRRPRCCRSRRAPRALPVRGHRLPGRQVVGGRLGLVGARRCSSWPISRSPPSTAARAWAATCSRAVEALARRRALRRPSGPARRPAGAGGALLAAAGFRMLEPLGSTGRGAPLGARCSTSTTRDERDRAVEAPSPRPGGSIGRAGGSRCAGALYLPFTLLGFGTDVDVPNVLRAGRSFVDDGRYEMSRGPGRSSTRWRPGCSIASAAPCSSTWPASGSRCCACGASRRCCGREGSPLARAGDAGAGQQPVVLDRRHEPR